MADASTDPSIWQYAANAAAPLIQGAGAGISASQVANANAEAASGVKAAGANSAALLDPYAQAGSAAENQLLALYGVNGNGAQAAAQANFANTPGYQFTKDMGTQAVQRQASATGGEFSSATLGALDQYNTGLAQQTYQNYIQNLFGLVQPGASAASAAGSQGIQAATQAGNFTVGKGQANASGIQGVSGALTNPLLSALYGGGSGSGGATNGITSIINGIRGMFGGGNQNYSSDTTDPSNWNTSGYGGINADGTLTADPSNPNFYNPATDPNSVINNPQMPEYDLGDYGDVGNP